MTALWTCHVPDPTCPATGPTRGQSHALRGFTIIEMLVSIGVAAVLFAVAAPEMGVFLQNSHIRAAAESMQNGLALARAEAVRQNQNVEFVHSAVGWVVELPGSTTPLHEASGKESEAGLNVVSTPITADRLTYDALGRRTANTDGSDPLTTIDIGPLTASTGTRYQPLRIQIENTGAARLCSPSAPATDSRACL